MAHGAYRGVPVSRLDDQLRALAALEPEQWRRPKDLRILERDQLAQSGCGLELGARTLGQADDPDQVAEGRVAQRLAARDLLAEEAFRVVCGRQAQRTG